MSQTAVITITRLVSKPNSLVEYVTTETIETKEDGTEVKTESTKEYVLEGIDKGGDHKWYNRAGQLHRDGDLPAIIDSSGGKHWCKNGIRHRDGDLPAAIYTNGCLLYYKDGKIHRDGDLPAHITENSGPFWNCNYWYKDGKLHRDGDLPAMVHEDGRKSYYKNGVEYTPAFLQPEINKKTMIAALETLHTVLPELIKTISA
jgi:hypothetical protein